jgi:hypothetical protein
MYGVGVCYFASIAPIKDILIYTILGVNWGSYVNFFKRGW